MRLLFVMRHAGYVRNFESTLRLLCQRGHDVHLAFQGRTKYAALDPAGIAAELAAEYPRFTHGFVPMRSDGWGHLGRELRLGVDVLRYLGPEYDQAPALRQRALRAAPPDMLAQAAQAPWNTGPGRRAYMAWLRAQNRAIPTDPDIDAFLREQRPDVLAVTPLIEPGAPQAEYLRSARAMGIRTAYCVASWDNLTNKGLVHGPVDLVTVWNDAMKREAVSMHGIPADRVAVTGAAAFDHWFDWRQSRSHEAFCIHVGLPPGKPFLLYLCSSKFVGPGEAGFVLEWLRALRARGGVLRDASVLIRPHPQNAAQWQGIDLGLLAPAVVWPAGEAPVDARTRNDYFDSMFHSAAVVGLNTTAQIEAAIIGRPVYTLLTNYRDTQEGTLHFRHLRDPHAGILHVAGSMDEHLTHIERALGATAPDPRLRPFVEAFVRPYGLAEPAAPRMVAALERLAVRPPAVRRASFWAGPLRRWLAPRAAAAGIAAAQPESVPGHVARAAEKARRATRRQPGPDTVRLQEKQRLARRKEETRMRQERVNRVSDTFRRMGERDRRAVVLNIINDIPARCFVDLIAANKPVRLDYDRTDIHLQVTSPTEVFRVRACGKEPFTIQWIHDRFSAGDVLYDIGANVGAYSLVAAKNPGAGARVFSFEASYANVAAINANVALNGAGDAISVLPVALSDATALDVFHLRDAMPGGARHALGGSADVGGSTVSQAVMTFRLDDLVEQLRLPLPAHIKLDVDGGELAVLAGAERTLASPALKTMMIEVATELSDEVTRRIERGGLHLESRIRKRNKAGEDAVWYGIFSRGGDPSKPVETIEFSEPAADGAGPEEAVEA